MKAADFKQGDIIGNRYTLIERVDQEKQYDNPNSKTGAFGFLWKARDKMNADNFVVVKFFDEDEVKKRFRDTSEALVDRLLKLLKSDPPKIKSDFILTPMSNNVHNEDGVTYYIMPYCSQGDLGKKINKLDDEEVWHVIKDVADGLSAIHNAGKIHNDIKPANLLVDDKHNYVITDLDFIASDGKSTDLGEYVKQMGSIDYCSPERLDGKPLSMSCDIYSLGITISELILGRIPVSEERSDIKKIIPSEYSDSLKNLVAKCLKNNSEERPKAKEISALAIDEINRIERDRRSLGTLADNIKEEVDVWRIIHDVAKDLDGRDAPFGGIRFNDITQSLDRQSWLLWGNGKPVDDGYALADDIASLGRCMQSIVTNGNIQISDMLKKTIDACVRQTKEDRPRADELVQCAERAIQSKKIDFWWLKHRHRNWKRRNWIAATIAMVVVVVAAVLFSLLPQNGNESTLVHDTVTYIDESDTIQYIIDENPKQKGRYHIKFLKSPDFRAYYDGEAKLNDNTGHWELDGRGVLTNTDSNRFDGTFKNNKLQDGKYLWPNGCYYIGNFEEGEPYDGKYFDRAGNLLGSFDKGIYSEIK